MAWMSAFYEMGHVHRETEERAVMCLRLAIRKVQIEDPLLQGPEEPSQGDWHPSPPLDHPLRVHNVSGP